MFEIYHVAYAVRHLESALRAFHSVLGGRPTEPQEFDMLVRRPLESPTATRIRGRSAWLVGQPTPIEFGRYFVANASALLEFVAARGGRSGHPIAS